MIGFDSSLREVSIEGSPSAEPNAAGELVIDVGEIRAGPGGLESLHCYQLKHSTVRVGTATPPSELKKTIKGFADRFAEYSNEAEPQFSGISFYFVSNRPISPEFKSGVRSIAEGGATSESMVKKLEKFTGLNGAALRGFCAALTFEDQEADYQSQEKQLRAEIELWKSGIIEETATLPLLDLVARRALPESSALADNAIRRADVLVALDIKHSRQVFPAPAAMESISNAFEREQNVDLGKAIRDARDHIIVEATGGVGKSVVAQQLVTSFPRGSEALV